MLSRKGIFAFFTFILSSFYVSLPAENAWNNISGSIDQLSTLETVYMDNAYIQTYNGLPGIWKSVRSEKEAAELAERYGVTLAEVRDINALAPNIDKRRGTYWFFPFSAEYLASLDRAGTARQVWEVPRGEFLWPVHGARISSRIGRRWGRFHNGMDIAASSGTMVVAAMDGEVKRVLVRHRTYGNVIDVAHNQEYLTRYAHLSVALVREGDLVKKGQILGYSGNTGRSTGPHLHFEVQCMGIVLNPEFFLPSFSQSMQAALEFEAQMKDKLSN